MEKVEAQWNISVSRQTIKRVLKAVGLSWHRFRRIVGGAPDSQEYADKQVQLEVLKQAIRGSRRTRLVLHG